MRVRISYGMDIKDVPFKVAELLETAAAETRKLSKSLMQISNELNDDNEDYKYLLMLVEKAKNNFADIDLTIAESQQILMGLQNFENGEQDVPDGRSTMDTGRNTAEET